jgi:hypothetical protein
MEQGKNEGKFENHWGKWVNSEEPVTGVIQNNNVEWLNDETMNGINISFEEWYDNLSEEEKELGDENSTYEENSDTYLIGDWIKDEQGKYEPDKTGEYAAITSETNTQVVWSKFTKRCALCSPCYPGQGDLDTPGE